MLTNYVQKPLGQFIPFLTTRQWSLSKEEATIKNYVYEFTLTCRQLHNTYHECVEFKEESCLPLYLVPHNAIKKLCSVMKVTESKL